MSDILLGSAGVGCGRVFPVPLEEHFVVVSRTWWKWFLREKKKKKNNFTSGPGNISGRKKKKVLMLLLAQHSTRTQWTLGCQGEGGFWHCQLTCHFFPDMMGTSPFFCSRLTLLPGLQVLPLHGDFPCCFSSSSPSVGIVLTFASILFALQPNASA